MKREHDFAFFCRCKHANLRNLFFWRVVEHVNGCSARMCPRLSTSSKLVARESRFANGARRSKGRRGAALAEFKVYRDSFEASSCIHGRSAYGLHATTPSAASGSYIVQVDSRTDHLNVLQAELRALSYQSSVTGDQRAAIVVQPVSVASLLVGVEIDSAQLLQHLRVSEDVTLPTASGHAAATYLESRFLDEIHSSIQLAQFVVTGRCVQEDFHAVKALRNVWAFESRNVSMGRTAVQASTRTWLE